MTLPQNHSVANILAERGLDGDANEWTQRIQTVTAGEVEKALTLPPGTYSLEKLTALISPAAENYLEQMARLAHNLTIQRFGRTIKLYAPLYLSNLCANSCLYCGFNKQTDFQRTRLSIEEALADADIIAAEGFRDLLLVSSEDPEWVTADYLVRLASELRRKFSSNSIEIYQMSADEYARLFASGIEGVTLYQETYNRSIYNRFHPAGPKADYDRRLRTPDDFASAQMREIGLGALLGLSDWRIETLALAEHAHYLLKKYWQSRVSFSFPRLRPASHVDSFLFEHLVSDKHLAQMIMALRLCFADAGLVLSTRESARLRNHLINLGITKLSAGSKTNPGGYCGHLDTAKQFEIDDNRTCAQVCQMLRRAGFDPVFKDWDTAFTS
jgi:2-iminoacetate synthase